MISTLFVLALIAGLAGLAWLTRSPERHRDPDQQAVEQRARLVAASHPNANPPRTNRSY